MVFQMIAGIWVFISPFVLGYRDTILAVSNMIFGAIVVILGVGTTFFEFYHPLLSSTAVLIASGL
jgi:hypothetical protein